MVAVPRPHRPLLVLLLTLTACASHTTTVRYPRSEADFLNPERGFFIDIDLVAGGDFSFVRAQGYTLAYAGVRLDPYRASELPPTLLAALDDGFASVRAAGIKVILRFVYNDERGGHDAPKAQIMAHLDQLRPVLAANADVIAVMQAGFIGAWGEWHASTNQLDNPVDRHEILAAILTALPTSRSTTVRRPMFKANTYGDPLTATAAFDGTPPARVGHDNGCFLASETDYGTYGEPIDAWKAFVAQEGRFTPVGGETCKANPPRTDCPTALAELARMHWSFLSALYHPDVLDAWAEQGCRARIARELGYRFELRSATFDDRVAPGGVLHVTVRLVNTGYAAPFNPRPLYITLDGLTAATKIDPRRWEPGATIVVKATLRVPADTTAGRHRLGLWLPDTDPRLRQPTNVDLYSIRIANARWEAPYNILTHDLIVDPAAEGPVDQTATTFEVLP